MGSKGAFYIRNHIARDELLQQIVSGAYDPSNVDNASQDETITPKVLYPDAQTLGIQKVVLCPYIQEAPAPPCSNLLLDKDIVAVTACLVRR